MPPVVIDSPILKSAVRRAHPAFPLLDEGITDEIAEGRRESGYFLPIASPRKKSGQMKFDTEWTQDRFFSSPRINRIRERVNQWRQGGYVGVTPTTLRLLDYWNDPARERKLFFCQIEALETAIYLTEVASGFGDAWIENDLRQENADFNGGLPRLAMKMATGSSKTVVMGMLIAWQALNKLEDRHDRRFSDAFLVVAPGITIRDRLRVLLPQDPSNYYRERDLVPSDLTDRLGQARIVITNYHAFLLRERGDAARLTKSILTRGAPSPFVETPDQMVRRVCRELGGKKQIIVLNDEAHHCYRGKSREDAEALIGDDRVEAKKDKAAKTATARTLWVPAVNNHGAFGRWAFVEVTDPWDAKGTIRQVIAEATVLNEVAR